MMKSAENGLRGDPAVPLDRSAVRRILVQEQMRSDFIVQQGLRTPTELAFVSFCIDGIRGLALAFACTGRSTGLVVLYSVAR